MKTPEHILFSQVEAMLADMKRQSMRFDDELAEMRASAERASRDYQNKAWDRAKAYTPPPPPPKPSPKMPELVVLGLESLPKSVDELRSARRRAMLKVHPDRGGSEEMAVTINQAYDFLAEKI